MIKSVTLALLAAFGVGQSAESTSGYVQRLKDLSFDMNLQHEYPINWETYGTAVPILSKVKVLPHIPQSNGQIFLKQELATTSWDATFQIGL